MKTQLYTWEVTPTVFQGNKAAYKAHYSKLQRQNKVRGEFSSANAVTFFSFPHLLFITESMIFRSNGTEKL